MSDTESLHSWTTESSSVEGSMWNGFLLEEFPAYGTREFAQLRDEWSKFGLSKGHDYIHKPRNPGWTTSNEDGYVEVMKKITEEHKKLRDEREYDTESEPQISEEKLRSFCCTMQCSRDQMREFTRYIWQREWLLFSDQHPKFWFELLGDRNNAKKLYTYEGIKKKNLLTGVWGLLVSQAFKFELRNPNWRLSRRYQNLDGSEIRPIMTVYKELRDQLGVDAAELVDVLFEILPNDAFPELNYGKSYAFPELNYCKSYWKDCQGAEVSHKKRHRTQPTGAGVIRKV